MHTITTRPPTTDERRVIVGQAKPDFASYGCLTLFFGVIPISFLGKFGFWLGSRTAPQSAIYGRRAGWVLGLLFFFAALLAFRRFERRRQKRAQHDQEDQVVQEIAVSDSRVFEIGLINDNEPILAFDIGEGKLLFLQGQWLRESDTYGAPRHEGDPDERFLNGFSEPYAFPSRSFTLVRLPHSGWVLSIRAQGQYLAPEKSVEALRKEYEFGNSELFEGTLENVAEVMAQAHAKRFVT